MAVRVEKWRAAGALRYRVVGLAWGGDRRVDALSIRIGPGSSEEREPCTCEPRASVGSWSLWTHDWQPPAPGTYVIRVRSADRSVRARRLEAGAYDRSVYIDEA